MSQESPSTRVRSNSANSNPQLIQRDHGILSSKRTMVSTKSKKNKHHPFQETPAFVLKRPFNRSSRDSNITLINSSKSRQTKACTWNQDTHQKLPSPPNNPGTTITKKTTNKQEKKKECREFSSDSTALGCPTSRARDEHHDPHRQRWHRVSLLPVKIRSL